MRNRVAVIIATVGLITHLLLAHFLVECIYNSGVAFGINISVVFPVIAFMFILLMVLRDRSEGLYWALLIASVGNLVDRVLYGGVCDYINIWKLSVFNINDGIIVSLVIILIVQIWTGYKNTK